MPDKHEVGGSSPLGPTISLEEKSRETDNAVIPYNPTMKVSLLTFFSKESKCSLKTE